MGCKGLQNPYPIGQDADCYAAGPFFRCSSAITGLNCGRRLVRTAPVRPRVQVTGGFLFDKLRTSLAARIDSVPNELQVKTISLISPFKTAELGRCVCERPMP